MKKLKKGFTLVELVIVIAVIAILAAVLIPTISSVVGSAHKSAVLQEATNLKIEMLAIGNADFDEYCDEMIKKYWVKSLDEGTTIKDNPLKYIDEDGNLIDSSSEKLTEKFKEYLVTETFDKQTCFAVKLNVDDYISFQLDEELTEDEYALKFEEAVSDLESEVKIGFRKVADEIESFVEYKSNGYKVIITKDEEISITKTKA